MHNFLEGILQHQLHVLWGIGHMKVALKEISVMETDETASSSKLSDNSDNSDWQGSQHGSTSGLTDDLTHMDVNQDACIDVNEPSYPNTSRMPTPTPESISLSLDNKSNSNEVNTLTPDSNKIFNFTVEELEVI